ncbi:MAG: hypothetical protein KF883_11305 [Thermomicrobiales bacterium]|nr:hypothetical protein [Thermomicrobiales bacterium]
MNTGLTLRQRPSLDISEAATRRLQIGVWLLLLLLALGLYAQIVPGLWNDFLDLDSEESRPIDLEAFHWPAENLGISMRTLTRIWFGFEIAEHAILAGISAILLLKRQGTDWFAWYLSLTMIASIGIIYPPMLHDVVNGQLGWLISGRALAILAITSVFFIPYLFPTGRFEPRWMVLPAGLLTWRIGEFVLGPGDDSSGVANPSQEVAVSLFLWGTILSSVVYRYWRKATSIQKQQMKWGVAGAVVADPMAVLGDALMRNADNSFGGFVSMLGWSILIPLSSLAFPVCLTIAILRFRLFDIDLYLGRTLVWVLMTILVIAAYVGIVFGVGSMIKGDQTTVLSLIALGLTAVFFQPVRQRVQQWINRLLFGDRDDPYRVVRQLATDLSETAKPVEALRSTVRTLTEALRLPYAAITLETDASPVAMAGAPGSTEIDFPLIYQSQPVGQLIVSPRGGASEFDATDRQLLDDLALQIGVVAHNVRLTNDLQASRERIVTAREEERRRLRRDLHDGLGAQLAALSMQASAMKATIDTDPDSAIEQATELQQELRTAIADIRRLVQGLRPATLDDLGLIGALQNRIATVNLGDGIGSGESELLVALDAPDDLGDLPAAVEVAIYRIVDEALTNVVRHARADRCMIRIVRHNAEIRVTIEDDGVGIPPNRTSGVGLQSMRERALELGGSFETLSTDASGARIVAILPISA